MNVKLFKLLYACAFIILSYGAAAQEDDSLYVLALGDSTYAQFCEAGRKLEALLLARGAKTFADRVEVDLDFEEPVAQWSRQVLEYGAGLTPAVDPSQAGSRAQNFLSVVPSASQWSRKNPFKASVQHIQKITGLETARDRHR